MKATKALNAKSTTPKFRLYNPKWVCAASLLFTPIFGGLLQAKNWEQLGERDEARISRFWVRSSIWLVIVYLIMQVIFRHEPVMAWAGPWFLVVLWAAWMITHGRKQIRHVNALSAWEALPFGKTMTIGILGWVLYGMVSFTLSLALMLTGFEPFDPPVKAPENGVIIKKMPGEEATVEELAPPAEVKPESSGKVQ